MAADYRAETVKLHAASMGGGQSRIVCPWCSGGSDNERSLSVLVNERGQVSWRCFRASCGAAGGNREIRAGGLVGKPPRYFYHPTKQCDLEQRRFFLTKFNLDMPSSWRYSETVDRYVWPVLGPEGQRRGVVARSYSGAKPKADTFKELTAEVWLHWTRPAYCDAGPIVLVEDIVSAEKVSQCDALGVALLGTYLSDEAVYELARYQRGRRIVLALDADAFGQALKQKARHGGQFNPPMTVWRLTRDLKDEAPDRIRELLESTRT